METFDRLTTGAKIVLGATAAFLIVSFLNWFEIDEDLTGGIEFDAGISMWHGIGVVAGLLALALLAWLGARLAGVDLNVGISPSMITMALAGLLLLFTLLRVLFGYEGLDRTIWLWLGLLLAIAAAVGAWMNMTAAGESFDDVKRSFGSAASSARQRDDRGDAASGTTTPPSTSTPPPTTPGDSTVDTPNDPPRTTP